MATYENSFLNIFLLSSSIGLFVFLLFHYKNYLFLVSPLSAVCFANIFFKYVACLFIALILSFENQKFRILMWYKLPVFLDRSALQGLEYRSSCSFTLPRPFGICTPCLASSQDSILPIKIPNSAFE